MAQKQALLGVFFHGIQRLPREMAPTSDILMQWMGTAQRIRQMNARLFQDSVKVAERFKKEGFRCCILKGQGNALMYPDPFMRTAGDIDILVLPSQGRLTERRKKVVEYVNGRCPGQTVRYHHIDFPVTKTPIEVHFTPSYMFNPVANHRMQLWFDRVMDLQCSNMASLPDGFGEIPVPTVGFNLVYILSHLYRHVFSEGIGLRQLLDYYYVLMQDVDEAVRQDAVTTIVHLGMAKFARGTMWVLHTTMGLPRERMLFEMDERQGRFLLDEILAGGNFGQYDQRLGDKTHEGKWRRYFRMTLRNMRFVRMYASEALCEPLFRTWWAFH